MAEEEDVFKKDFKYYKSKRPPPDLKNVLDFSKGSTVNNTNLVTRKPAATTDADAGLETTYGLKPISEWHIYELVEKPGLVFIANPFVALGQRYWPIRCLKDYTKRPQRLNLDRHGCLKDEETWWEQLAVDKSLAKKLRWSTLGYHHNWDTKEYSEAARDEFPRDLAKLSRYMVTAAGFSNFRAEAAIINFYYMDSTLSGHTDYSEPNREAPLISLSFGQSAIFMIGGRSRADKPTAMYIHSGDVVVMSGQSRLNYHGVPRIVPAQELPWQDVSISNPDSRSDQSVPSSGDDLPSELLSKRRKLSEGNGGLDLASESNDIDSISDTRQNCFDEMSWQRYGDFLKIARINLNVRQVLLPGQIDVSIPVM